MTLVNTTRKSFSRIISNIQEPHRPLLCDECTQTGLTARHPKPYTCTKCQVERPAAAFNAKQLYNYTQDPHRPLLCDECQQAGFTAWQLQTYTCKRCRTEQPAATFDAKQLYNFNVDPSRPLECNDCFKKRCPYKCARCELGLRSTEHLTPAQLKGHRSARKTAIVCKTCFELGFTAQDTQSYTCQQCSQAKAATHFQSKQLENWRARGGKTLQCLDCNQKDRRTADKDVSTKRRRKT